VSNDGWRKRIAAACVVLVAAVGCDDANPNPAQMTFPVGTAGSAPMLPSMPAGAGAAAGAGVPAPSGGMMAIPPAAGAPAAGMGGMAAGAGAGGEPTATAGASGMAAGAGGDAMPATGTLPPVDAIEIEPPHDVIDGPFEPMQDLASGPGGRSGLFHPTELGKDGLKHPIFLWSCGGGSQPSQYVDHFNRLASHGFVIVADVSTGSGTEQIASLDWLIEENDRMGSPLYQKLDTTKVGAGGHSLGSVSTFAIGDDERLSTTIHVAGGSFDGRGSANLRNPTAFVCGQADTLATPQCMTDWQNTTVPTFYTLMQGVDHRGAAREGLPVIIAWLRWHLGGEADRASMFLDPSCTFCQGKWMGQNKNF